MTESDEIFHEKFMNTWIWIEEKAWSHEYEYGQKPWTHEFKSDKLVNPWISFVKNPWTREYEY